MCSENRRLAASVIRLGLAQLPLHFLFCDAERRYRAACRHRPEGGQVAEASDAPFWKVPSVEVVTFPLRNSVKDPRMLRMKSSAWSAAPAIAEVNSAVAIHV